MILCRYLQGLQPRSVTDRCDQHRSLLTRIVAGFQSSYGVPLERPAGFKQWDVLINRFSQELRAISQTLSGIESF